MQRKSGILCPIFSLPSKYGMGSFGKESYKFIDFLKSSGQTVWQILPLVQTGYGNSPYSSVCSHSLNPYFISLVELKKQGLLTKTELEFAIVQDKKYIDYGELYSVRYPLLRKAFSRFNRDNVEFKRYLRKKESLDYAMFMAIKYASGQKPFYEWEEELKNRDKKSLDRFYRNYKEEVLFWQFLQFVAKKQWLSLKNYANQNGVVIMGDMPLYVALDSVDVWVNPSLYKLDEKFLPKKVAGVPPDYFSEKGQLWGNPVYDYSVHEQNGFKWWVDRLKKALEIYDYVRIDHFRGLDRYYQVDADAENAICGEWVKVPSEKLFNAIHQKIDKDRIIAEDLGIIDDGVRDLLKATGYPGMKILLFAFDGQPDNLYLPENIAENYICYTGTHDNDTLMGFIGNLTEWDKNNLVNGVKNSLKKLGVEGDTSTDIELAKALINLGAYSKAKWFILPLQDVFGLNSEYRINEPGTVKEQNWAVKFTEIEFGTSAKTMLRKLCKKYKRI